MAIKQVKEYYKQVENMYLELVSSLQEMQEDFKQGEVTEEQLNNLLKPVEGIKQNYIQLSYIMHLLMQPNRKEKKKNYEDQHKDRTQFFKSMKVDMDSKLDEERNALSEFEKQVKEGKLLNGKEND